MPFNRRSQAFVNLQVEREHGLGLDPSMAYSYLQQVCRWAFVCEKNRKNRKNAEKSENAVGRRLYGM